MKKNLLILSSFLGILSSSAQITITSADVVTPTKMLIEATDTMPLVSVGFANSVSQTWNMSSLHTHTIDSSMYLPYSAFPNPSFPTSNLIIKPLHQTLYAYARNSTSGLSMLGNAGTANVVGNPTPISSKNSSPEIILNFPMTYGTNIANNFTTTTVYPYNAGGTDSIRIKSKVTKVITADAWGSLTTPLGIYNALRVKEVKQSSDSAFFHIPGSGWQFISTQPGGSSTDYFFWANGVGFPLVVASANGGGTIVSVTWLKALPITTDINETVAATEVSVFPNPAQNEINFAVETSNAAIIHLFDISGRMINSYSVTSDHTTVDISNLTNGVYSYSLIDKDNVLLNRGKFIIAK
jgi:hypothetical protein